VEILRFGPGHRRSAPPSGSSGLADAVIWSDPRARVTELAFSRQAYTKPQTSPDTALFIVVSGGGWVGVGDERMAVNHGEAVIWPAGVAAAAWTDGSEMRAILIEVPDRAIEVEAARVVEAAARAAPATGGLADRDVRPEEHDESQGEPW
jgi:quercetin dioxygenase-like cupin family protein